MKNIEGRVVVITGAASGIGLALARQFAKNKCLLAISDIDAAALERLTDELTEAGTQVFARCVDVAQRESVYDYAEAVIAHFGRADIVINNAGVGLASTIEDMSYEDMEWLMGINFWGVVYGTKAFLPHMKQANTGHIVNISSIFGIIGAPTQAAYNAAKFAVRGFTECLRQELEIEGSGVSCTSVHPGGIRTNIVGNSRVGNISSITGTDNEQAIADIDRMFVTSAEDAANAIIKGIRNSSRRVLIGTDARVMDIVQRVMPGFYQRLVVSAQRIAKQKSAKKRHADA